MTGPLLSRSSLLRPFAAMALTAAISISAASAQQPAPTTSAGCGVLKGVTTCNWPAFVSALKAAQTVAVEDGPIDRPTTGQLNELAIRLGKSVADSDAAGDLTFAIVPARKDGITIGPGDQPILKLQIFNGPTSRGTLIWEETLIGQPDHPWPSNVHSVIEQFRARFK